MHDASNQSDFNSLYIFIFIYNKLLHDNNKIHNNLIAIEKC